VLGRKRTPSVSRLERGRGMAVVGRRRAPSVSCFERGREMGVVGRKWPLHSRVRTSEGPSERY